MNKLSIEDLTYFAGFIDADGSIFAQIVKREDYVLKYQIRISVTFVQKKSRQHHLEDFKKLIGSGTVRDRGDDMSELALVGQNTVLPFLNQIQPYLRIKKKQANLVIRICEQLNRTKNDADRFIETCKLADHVAKLNDSKNRKITAETVTQTFYDFGLIQKN